MLTIFHLNTVHLCEFKPLLWVFTKRIRQEEITAKQDAVKAEWAENNGFASWVFNEETCAYEAPTPKPADLANQTYVWNEETTSWIILEETP